MMKRANPSEIQVRPKKGRNAFHDGVDLRRRVREQADRGRGPPRIRAVRAMRSHAEHIPSVLRSPKISQIRRHLVLLRRH